MAGKETGDLPTSVLLTGSTGYVGIYLLAELLRHSDMTPICLVRAENDAAAYLRLQARLDWYFPGMSEALSRAMVVAGDLAQPRLSLPEARYKRLADAADIIVHAAADTRGVAPPEEVFRTNVDGTRHLLELAEEAGGSVFHYLSTMSVAGQNPDPAVRRFSEEDFDIGQRFRGVYDESKFEAERLVRTYAASPGRGSIYRVDNVAADSGTGRFQINIEDNLTYHVFKTLVVAGIAPSLPDITFNFSQVDRVARAIMANVRAIRPSYCLHVTNPHNVAFDVVVSWLQALGYSITVLSTEKFLEQAMASGRRHDEVFLGCLWVQLTVANQQTNRIAFDHDYSLRRLRQLGVGFPKCDHAWWTKTVEHAVSVGYLPPF